MAKNDSLPTATFVRRGEDGTPSAQYMRKDTHLLLDGTWFIATPCTVCGLVDEAVSWEEAKTPHHAGLIADRRHQRCNEASAAHELYLAGLEEIRVAEGQREQQARNVQAALERVRTCEAVLEAFASPQLALPPGAARARERMVKLRQAELDAAAANLRRHEKAMLAAEKRVVYIRETNAPRSVEASDEERGRIAAQRGEPLE